MDVVRRMERRRRLFYAYGMAVPAVMMAGAAWAYWGRKDYEALSEALVGWPIATGLAWLVSLVFVRAYDNASSRDIPRPLGYLGHGLACVIIGPSFPPSMQIAFATLLGWLAALALVRKNRLVAEADERFRAERASL